MSQNSKCTLKLLQLFRLNLTQQLKIITIIGNIRIFFRIGFCCIMNKDFKLK